MNAIHAEREDRTAHGGVFGVRASTRVRTAPIGRGVVVVLCLVL
jgi:hypothetical protein